MCYDHFLIYICPALLNESVNKTQGEKRTESGSYQPIVYQKKFTAPENAGQSLQRD